MAALNRIEVADVMPSFNDFDAVQKFSIWDNTLLLPELRARNARQG
jgi:hypothetical protein